MSKIETRLQSSEEAEIEARIAEIEEVPYGDVLASVFRNNTIPESRELKDGTIYGKVKKVENVLTELYRSDSGFEKGAILAIFQENKAWGLDVIFLAGKITHSQFPPTCDIYVKFNGDTFSLRSPYHNWLMMVVSEVASKASQIPRKKIQEKTTEWERQNFQ
jgi:hypothetical protein